MAGIPSHTKSSPSKRSGGSTREKAKHAQSGTRKNSGGIQQREQLSETPTSSRKDVSVQLTSSKDSSSDLLFITTDKPANFKDPSVQKEISRHVMKDYQNKQQSGRETGRGKGKEFTTPRGDKGTGISSINAASSHTSKGESIGYMNQGSTMATPQALHSSVLTREMIYPLNIDLSSLDFQHRLGHLLSRYMSAWFGAQAARLCGGGNHNTWENWMPHELENETLLYAQAFAAVNHIHFLNPEAYETERWALKGRAIQAISETLNDPAAAEDDGNIGAVLCMAVVAPLETSEVPNFTTHMHGLRKLVSIRGGLPALRSNRILHDAICLCDLSGAVIFRTNPVLVTPRDCQEDGIVDDLFNSPLQCCTDFSEPQGQARSSPDMMQTLKDLHELTLRWKASYSDLNLEDSAYTNRCASIERRLSQHPSPSTTAAQSQLPEFQIREACRLAGLIYFRALFYSIPFSSPDNVLIMQGLRAALENSIVSGWEGCPGLLLWALLVGTAVARSEGEATFFAGHLSTTCFCLVAKWHDVQQMLATFLRMERSVEQRAAEFSD